MKKIQLIEAAQLKRDIPDFRQGDTLSIQVRVIEGEKERLQQYKGVVISRRGSGISETMVVRKISHGIGVERIFPVHAPTIASIEVLKRGKVRRAKLFYLRKRTGKSATKIKDAFKKVEAEVV